MKKSIILKYIIINLPLTMGIMLYGLNIYNTLSTLLLFLGGYISIKNTFDYRKVKKNINNIKNGNSIKNETSKNSNKLNISYYKKIKKIPKVRKKIKQ